MVIHTKERKEPMYESKLNINGVNVPRVIFLNSKENVLMDLSKENRNLNYRYYRMDETSVVECMKTVLNIFKDANVSAQIASDEAFNKRLSNSSYEFIPLLSSPLKFTIK